MLDGGESGIRTHGPLAGTRDFQSRPIGLSGISPCEEYRGLPASYRRTFPQSSHLWPRLPERCGGEGGIRTHVEVAPKLVFETSALSRSATSPSNKENSNKVFKEKIIALELNAIRLNITLFD